MTRLAPLWQQNSTYPAATDRSLMAALWPTSSSTGGAPSLVSNTMSVSVAAGFAAVALIGGNYTELCRWDAAEVVTLPAAPPSGQSRIDLIIVQVRDAVVDAGANNDFVIVSVTGTAAPSNPVAPAAPNNAYVICQVTVPGAATNLNAATLVDRRNQFPALGAAAGGILPGGYNQITANSGSVGTTALGITGLGLTLTLAGGRRTRVRIAGSIAQTSGPSICRPQLWLDGAKVAGQYLGIGVPPANFAGFTIDYIAQLPAGSHNFQMYMTTDAGSALVFADATTPAYILAEDIGGN